MTTAAAAQDSSFDVIIVGGGIAGLATAVALLGGSNKDLRVAVLERATCLQPVGAALGLFPNGLRALQAIAPTVHSKVLASCIPTAFMVVKDASDPSRIVQTMDRRATTTTTTTSVHKDDSEKDSTAKDDTSESSKETQRQEPKDSGGGSAVGGVHMIVWYLLQQYLRQELPSNVVHLGMCVESVDMLSQDNGNDNEEQHPIKVTALNRNDGDKHETFSCRVLIGADGIHSTLRQQLWPASCSMLHYRQKVMFRAVMDCRVIDPAYCPPRGEQVGYKDPVVAGKLFAFRETSPGLLTFTSMATFDDVPAHFCGSTTTATDRKAHLQQLFADYPAQVLHILDRCPAAAIYVNAIYDLDRVVDEWVLSSTDDNNNNAAAANIVLIGDAAHAMTPGMGQGANMGLEDAAELSHFLAPVLLDKDKSGDHKATVASAMTQFWKSRIERVTMVHAASRRMTLANNQAAAGATKDDKKQQLFQQQDPQLREKVNGWVPSKFSE